MDYTKIFRQKMLKESYGFSDDQYDLEWDTDDLEDAVKPVGDEDEMEEAVSEPDNDRDDVFIQKYYQRVEKLFAAIEDIYDLPNGALNKSKFEKDLKKIINTLEKIKTSI